VNHPKILAYKFGIDRYDFNELVPERKDLGAYDIDVVNQLVRKLVWVQSTRSPNGQRNQSVASGSQNFLAHALISLLLALEFVVLRDNLVYLSIFTHSDFQLL